MSEFAAPFCTVSSLDFTDNGMIYSDTTENLEVDQFCTSKLESEQKRQATYFSILLPNPIPSVSHCTSGSAVHLSPEKF